MKRMAVRSGKGGRKRRRNDSNYLANDRPQGPQTKRRFCDLSGKVLVGRYVLKEFKDGVFLGKIMSYSEGLYAVDYEDGDFEEMESVDIRDVLIEEEYFDDDLRERRTKFEELLLEQEKAGFLEQLDERNEISVNNESEETEMPPRDGSPAMNDVPCTEIADDPDSMSDSSDDEDVDMGSGSELPAIPPPPELPSSSGTIAVPEEYVPYLFSVYGFLRTFSVRLFLSPFTLDDLVGCLNCTVPNTLLNAIHVALLRAVRRNLESQRSDGSEIASKCLRCHDWKLLDMLTWPVYLVSYLLVKGYFKGDHWKGYDADALKKDYCAFSVGKKLMALQILCDDALDCAEIRAEMDIREESEIGVDSDDVSTVLPECGPRKAHPRTAKITSLNDRFSDITSADNEDRNSDECRLCGVDGTLLCCDGCPWAYHSRCIAVSKVSIPEGCWFCPECTISKLGPQIANGTSLRGAEVFGTDAYGQQFVATCNHLVVVKVWGTSFPFVKYYNSDDIPRLLRSLNSSVEHGVMYSEICLAVSKYWDLPERMIVIPERVQVGKDSKIRKDEVCLASASLPFPMTGNFRTSDGIQVEKNANERGSLVEHMSHSVQNIDYAQSALGGSSLVRGKQGELAIAAASCDASGKDHGLTTCVKSDGRMIPVSASQQACFSGLTQQRMAGRLSSTESVTCASQVKYSSAAQQNGIIFPGKLPGVRNEGTKGVVGVGSQKSRANCLYMGSMFKPQAYINHYVHGEFAASAAANLTALTSEEHRASDVHLSDPRKAMSINVSLQTRAFSSAAIRFFWPGTEKKLTEVPRERCGWCLSCRAPATSKKACLLNAAALNATRVAMKTILGIRLAKNVEGSLYSIAIYMLYMEECLHGLVVGPFCNVTYCQLWRKQVEQALTCDELKDLLLELEENLCSIALSGDWYKLVENWAGEVSAVQSTCPVGSAQKRGPGRRGRKPLNASDVSSEDSCDSSNDFCWWCGRRSSRPLLHKGTLNFAVLRKAARQGSSRKIFGIHYSEGGDIPKRSKQLIWRAAVEMSKNTAWLALQVRYLDHHVRWSDLVRPDQVIQDGKGAETDTSFFRNASICDKKLAENKVMYAVVFGRQKHLSSRILKNIMEKEEAADGNDKFWFPETKIPLFLIKDYEEKVDDVIVEPAKRPSESLSKLQRKQLKASRKDIFIYLTRKRDDLYLCLCACCGLDVLIKSAVECSICRGYCHEQCTLSSIGQPNEEMASIMTCKNCVSGGTPAQKINSAESPTSPLALQGHECQGSLSSATGTKQKASQAQETQSAPSGSKSSRPKALQGQEHQNVTPVPKSVKPKTSQKSLPSSIPMEGRSVIKADVSESSLATKGKKRLCNWGLIWRKKNVEETGPEFRRNNIILRGNPDNFEVSGVICNLCRKSFTSEFMFIRCEACSSWYHSDAVELDEAKLPDLQGFKCCRCRRIKSPVCPYSDPERLKAAEAKKPHMRTSKQGKIAANSVTVPVSISATASDQTESPLPGKMAADSISATISDQTYSLPTSPTSALEEDVFIQVNDPLLFSASNVELLPELKIGMDYEWDTPSVPGPQKLPIRRHLKNEKDNDGNTGNSLSPAEVPSEFRSDSLSYPTDIMSSLQPEWDVSTSGLEDGMACEYEGLNYQETDYEPQTYFSFTELLASDDGQLEGVDVSGSIPDTLDEWGSVNPEEFLDQSDTGFLGDRLELEPFGSDEPGTDFPCTICTQIDPVPDLECHTCGLRIHSHCSPWENSAEEEKWRCGKCRLLQ